MTVYTYAVEQLFNDQDPDYVVEVAPALVSWLDPIGNAAQPYSFLLREQNATTFTDHQLELTWDTAALSAKDAVFLSQVKRFRTRKTILLEDHPKLAAYGLAMIAISCFLKEKVLAFERLNHPDLLLDVTPGKIRGVEVAGRTSGGRGRFTAALNGTKEQIGKRKQLQTRVDLIEAYVSFWCLEPSLAHWEKIKP
jgi:hypothetical protein